jgi:hypothetical protein
MVGFGSGQIIIAVTVHAFNPQRIEPAQGTRLMASFAIAKLVGSGKRKPALTMDLTDILNNPGFWRMAFETIRTQGSFMQVGMAIIAILFDIVEYQRFMAGFAINQFMLPDQFIPGGIMIEGHPLLVEFPPGCGMTNRTINLETLPVGSLSCKHCETEQQT